MLDALARQSATFDPSTHGETWSLPAGRWGVLIGHPRLVNREEPGPAVRVALRSPVLTVVEEGGGYRLRLDPDRWPAARWATPDRLDLVALPSRFAHFREAVPYGGVLIPRGAQARLVAILERLTPVFAIEGSDAVLHRLDGPPTRAADTTLRLRMTRDDGVIRARAVVTPAGPSGAVFTPGCGPEHVLDARPDGDDGRAAAGTSEPLRYGRDLSLERHRFEMLRDTLPALSAWSDPRAPFTLPTIGRALELLAALDAAPGLAAVEWLAGDGLRLREPAEGVFVDVEITVGAGAEGAVDPHGADDSPRPLMGVARWFEAHGGVAVDGERVLDMRALLDGIAAGHGRFVQVADGEFVALDEAAMDAVERVAAFAVEGPDAARSAARGEGDRPVCLHPLMALAMAERGAAGLAQSEAVRREVERLREAARRPVVVPETFKGTLRGYQTRGFEMLARRAAIGVGVCLADDMGLGKTVQALALLAHRAPDGAALVVAPTSVVGQWEEQTARFVPSLRVFELATAEDRDACITGAGPGDVLLVSWGLLARESERLSSHRWATLVLDEAQMIKNAATRVAQASRALHADFAVALTGTPVENHLGELHSLFRVLNPGLLGTRADFRRRFAGPIERAGDPDARRRLRERIAPFLLRRTKSAVLDDLPPRTEVVLRLRPDPEHAALYEAVRREALASVAAEPGAGGGDEGPRRMRVLAALMRLRRACCHPALVGAPDVPSTKLAELLEHVALMREEGHRALVFSQFVDHLHIVRDALDAQGVPYKYLDGSTPSGQRRAQVAEFQAGEADLFLISLKAGGTGLDLTGADYVFHLDPWWNPAAEDQASDRAHRIGQSRAVTVYRLILEGTVEERILDLHAHKRDLADAILAGQATGGTLDLDAMLELLSDGG